MGINFGDRGIKEIRYGNTRITKAYYGSTLIYDRPYIRIKFHFDRTNVNPRGKFGAVALAAGAEFISTDDPQIWYAVTPLYKKGAGTFDDLLGIGKLFCKEGDGEPGTLLSTQIGTCQVLEITGAVDRIETIDRLFQKCSAITSISKTGFYDKFSTSTKLVNVNSVCNEDSNITDGSSLNGYLVLKEIASITTHASTFTNADSASNLDQIPTSWGGNMVPVSEQLPATKINDAGWTIDLSDPNCPDFTTIDSLQLFTTSSVSRYAGVNMKKASIWNKANGFATSKATYYYPAFFQGTGSWASTTSVTFHPTWIFAPNMYNGMLTASQTTGDMPGTLDHEAYGALSNKYGTFDPAKTIYFGFLVLNNDTDISNFDASTTSFAIHSNTNFLDSITLNWFEE